MPFLRIKPPIENAERQVIRGPAPIRPPDHSPRGLGFFFSLALHGSLVALVFLGPDGPVTARKPESLYKTLIAPNEKKLIWYRFAPKQLPDVSPLKSADSAPTPRGAIQSPQSIVAKPPKAAPGKQLIYLQAPKLQIEQEVKAPNLIAFAPVPAPPPIERPKPKAFIPPSDHPRPKTDAAPMLSEAPQVETTRGVLQETPKELGNVLAGIAKPRRVARAFVPPTPAGGSGKRNDAVTILDAGSAPAIPGGSSPETFTAAVIGLQPSSQLERIPQGGRPAQLSTGPAIGPPASGSGGKGGDGPGGSGGFPIPDLSIRGGAKPGDGGSGAPTPGSKGKGGEYQQTILQPSRQTLSVPLRPSSRTIAAALEARFRGRNVYTVIVPIPKMTQYSGDWIIWFAEREQNAKETAQMHAPMPVKKIDKVAPAAAERIEGRVQLAAIIRKDGHLESVSVTKSSDARINQAAVEDLQKWEFSPAVGDGASFDAEVVFEIPFNLPVEAKPPAQ